jgi:hypothetical protein
MNKKTTRRIFAVIVILVIIAGIGLAFAGQDNDSLKGIEDKVEKSLRDIQSTFAYAERAEIEGIMSLTGKNPTTQNNLVHDGDLYIAGQDCIVTGEIRGNVLVAGSDVRFSNPTVKGSVLVGSSNYSGDIDLEGSLYIFSGTVNDDSRIEGNVYVFGGDVTLTGTYETSVIMYGGNVTFSGSVAGDFVVNCDKLIIEDTASVGGKAEISVGSEEALNSLPEEYRENARVHSDYSENIKRMIIRSLIVTPIFMFLLGLLFLRFWEKRFRHIQKMVKEKCGWSILAGLGVLVLTPIVGLIVIMILWPASLFPVFAIILVAFLMSYLGGLVIIEMVGKWLWKLVGRKVNKYLSLLIGVIVVYAIFCLPLLVPQASWITIPSYILLYTTGAGAFAISIFNRVESE